MNDELLNFVPTNTYKKVLLGLALTASVLTTVFFIVIAPDFGLLILRCICLLIIIVLAYRISAPKAPFWIRSLFIVVLGQALLGYGFSNIAVGVGSARVTVSELILAVCLLAAVMTNWKYLWIVRWPGFILLIYCFFPLAFHLGFDLTRYGVTAARDALPLISTLFFFGGVACVACAEDKEQWAFWKHRFFYLLVLGTLLYIPLYPFQATVLALSPRAFGYQSSVPIIGYFTTTNIMAFSGLLATILFPNAFAWCHRNCPFRWVLLTAFFVFLAGIVMLQSRAVYVAFGASVIVLIMNGHIKSVSRFLLALLMGILILFILEVSGVELKGRVGKIGIDTLTEQVNSISKGDQAGAGSGGTSLRVGWWQQSLTRWNSSLDTITFGIGFGQALTNFSTGQRNANGAVAIVREPHNSYISILTRTGLFGFIPWLVFQISLMAVVWLKYREQRHALSVDADYWLWLFLFFLSLQITALVEPVFESPFFASPYYFLAGFALAEIVNDKKNWSKISMSKSGFR
jgi:hypothetical protein